MKTNWRKLNKELALLSEEQVLSLLNDERANDRRISVLERLHHRYTTLRAARERREILREARTL